MTCVQKQLMFGSKYVQNPNQIVWILDIFAPKLCLFDCWVLTNQTILYIYLSKIRTKFVFGFQIMPKSERSGNGRPFCSDFGIVRISDIQILAFHYRCLKSRHLKSRNVPNPDRRVSRLWTQITQPKQSCCQHRSFIHTVIFYTIHNGLGQSKIYKNRMISPDFGHSVLS